jgi:DNA-binding response OmpR family regulator
VILYVDGNEVNVSLRRFFFETNGFRVISARSAAEALDIVRAEPGTVDLVLSELVLPGGDGNTMMGRIRQMEPGIPLVLLSATVTVKHMDRGANADFFYPKGTLSPAELLERVRLMIRRKTGPRKPPVSAVVRAQVDDAVVYIGH